jgi:hypothetical protein
MNAVTKAISEAYFQIPREILDIVFRDGLPDKQLFTTIDDQIMRRVIKDRVLIDASLLSGQEVYIDLGRCKLEPVSEVNTIVVVPDALTDDRPIIQALSLANKSVGLPSIQSDVIKVSGSTNASYGGATSRLEVVGHNTVLIYDYLTSILDNVMLVTVEVNDNMSHLNPGTYPAFVKLVILAIKAYIYNYMIIKLDAGYIYQGHELGIMKEYVERYESANEEYLEYLNIIWRKVAMMNDPIAMSDYVRAMFPYAT